MKEKFERFCEEEIAVPAVGYFWKCFALFLLGVVVGFLISPVKKGIKLGCGNACNNGNNCSENGNYNEVPDRCDNADGKDKNAAE